MMEFLRQIATSWYVLPTLILLAFTAAGLYSFWWRDYCRERVAPDGYTLVKTEEHKQLEEGYRELCKKCFDQGVELDNLKTKPKLPQPEPVIDWIAINATDTDYDQELEEYTVGYVLSGEYHQLEYSGLDAEQARKLDEEFRDAIKLRRGAGCA